MARGPRPSILASGNSLALHSLDHRCDLHRAGSGSPVLSSAQREAAFLGNASGRGAGCRLLDWTLLRAGNLFPQLCQLQQDLWSFGCGDRFDGVALLEQLFHAGRGRTELRASQGNPQGPDHAGSRSQRADQTGSGDQGSTHKGREGIQSELTISTVPSRTLSLLGLSHLADLNNANTAPCGSATIDHVPTPSILLGGI